MTIDWAQLLAWAAPSVLAAILAYQVGQRRAHQDRRHRATELATALLVELRYVESTLRRMYREEKPLSYYWYVPLPWFEKLFPEARYFRPRTTHAAYDFYGLILELNARREVASKLTAVSSDDHHAYRVKVAATLERLGLLAEALKKEGGKLAPLTNYKVISGSELPPLPPLVFPEMEDYSNER